ncbi:hypothetical protein HYW87_01940 [Candidatus Roizmanbacteria bacterium]|nr:hypothetical protein [Candidatus Roizmanbacteria bacterium]
MQLNRTTLRIKENLKEALEKQAIEDNTTMQELFNHALEEFLNQRARKKAKKIIFKSHDLGVPLDNLRRKDYYKNL